MLFSTKQFSDSSASHYTIDYIAPSPNGKLVAFGISQDGSEQAVIHILDVANNNILTERIERAMYVGPMWTRDGDGFFYHQFQKLSDSMPTSETYLDSKAMYHKIGSDVANDRVIFSREQYPSFGLKKVDLPYPYVSPNSDQLFIEVNRGLTPNKIIYRIPLEKAIKDENLKSSDWIEVASLDDEVIDFAVYDSLLFSLTSKDTDNLKVSKSLLESDINDASILLEESEMILKDIQLTQNAVYVQGNMNGADSIVRISLDSYEPQPVPVPSSVSVRMGDSSPSSNGIFFSLNSWVRPESIYYYNLESDSLISVFEGKGSGILDNLLIEEVEVVSHDSVRVPLTIIYRKGTKLDGKNPAILYGYGAYGISMSPKHTPSQMVWYEQGGVVAIAHVRGGGEKGEAWHQAGKKSTKPNTWKDYIACAEYLIEAGYTSEDKVAALSGSAGGIMVGRAITERPDLFHAAIISVGVMNTVRFEETPNALQTVELGTVKDSLEFEYLYEMDAYHHVQDDTEYPATLFTAGMNDARVIAWQPGKMVARMQAATSSEQPILLRVAFDGGHYGSSSSERVNEVTDYYAFLLWQLGHPGFQLADKEGSGE